jgi:hypothetical protein
VKGSFPVGRFTLSVGGYHVVMFVLCLVALMQLALVPELSGLLGLNDLSIWFMDTKAILVANDTAAAGRDVFAPMRGDPLNRPHVYSLWWLGFQYLGLGSEHTFLVGMMWGGAFLITAVVLLRPDHWAKVIWGLFALVSPPVLLALNRGNNDLVVFTILGLGIWAGSHRSTWGRMGFIAAVAVATGLKYYPAVALFGLLLITQHDRHAWKWWIGSGIGVAFVLIQAWRSELKGMIPEPSGVYVFGARWLNLEEPAWRDFPLWPAALGSIALAGWVSWRGWPDRLCRTAGELRRDQLGFVVGAILLIGCFWAGSNFAYRLIFLVFTVAWFERCLRSADGWDAGRWFTILMATATGGVLWLDGSICMISWLASGYDPGVAARIARVDLAYRIAHELLYWTLVVGLMACLLTWARQAIAGLKMTPQPTHDR